MGYYGDRSKERIVRQVTSLHKNDLLFDTIPHEKILHMVKHSRFTVHHLVQSTNNYGEFMFIDIVVRPTPKQIELGYPTLVIEAYGLGEHFEGEKLLLDTWKINSIQEWKYYWRRNEPPQDRNRTQVINELLDMYCMVEKDGHQHVTLLRDVLGKEVFSLSDPTEFPPDAVFIPKGTRGFMVNNSHTSVHVQFTQEGKPTAWFWLDRSDRGKSWVFASKQRSERADLFNMLALLGDDDGAHTMLEDMGI